MKRNPFAPKTPGVKTTVVATELRHGSNSVLSNASRLVGRNGEINASDKRDLYNVISSMIDGASAGTRIVSEATHNNEQEILKARRQAIEAAFHSREHHEALGASLANEIYQAQNREGIMRSILNLKTVAQGETPMITMRNKNITVTVATSPTQIQTQFVRDNYVYPTEYTLQGKIYIEQREINRNKEDILDQKYADGLQAMMVAEDRIFRDLCLEQATLDNTFTSIIGTLSPTSLGDMRNKVTRWNLPAPTLLIANDLWVDFAVDGFNGLLEPMAQHELILTGQLGTMLGMNIRSDAFRHPEQKVMSKGELYVFSSPEHVGTYTENGGLISTPIDMATEGVVGRGWALAELQSQTIMNSRGVACAKRIK